MTNRFGLNSTKEMMGHLRNYLMGNDVMVDFTQAEDQGTAVAKQIVAESYAPANDEEPLFKKAKISQPNYDSKTKFTL